MRVFAAGLFAVSLLLVGAYASYHKPAQTPKPTALVARRDDGPRLFLYETSPSHELDRKGTLAPVRSLLNVKQRMHYGDYIWDDKNVPRGPAWIRVDLDSQLLSVFRGGNEIGTAVILYGATQKETPTGVFPILAKMSKHRSSSYDAEMPYTLRLTNDGISIHASNVRWGLATHGCIGVPLGFAQKMFDEVARGDKVLILSHRPVA